MFYDRPFRTNRTPGFCIAYWTRWYIRIPRSTSERRLLSLFLNLCEARNFESEKPYVQESACHKSVTVIVFYDRAFRNNHAPDSIMCREREDISELPVAHRKAGYWDCFDFFSTNFESEKPYVQEKSMRKISDTNHVQRSSIANQLHNSILHRPLNPVIYRAYS